MQRKPTYIIHRIGGEARVRKMNKYRVCNTKKIMNLKVFFLLMQTKHYTHCNYNLWDKLKHKEYNREQ